MEENAFTILIHVLLLTFTGMELVILNLGLLRAHIVVGHYFCTVDNSLVFVITCCLIGYV